ncbi:hypothetical protein FRC09_017153 [Ceratobasidium sp. 395]|nr:hypothetical protein FRC09_017153 [Ceratobasidium sp. 395]
MASEQTRLSTIRGYQLNLRPTSSPDTGSHLRDHEKPSAAVVGGAVISFVDGVDEDIKADVLNTLLFAQLVADGQADRQKEPDQWYAVFRDVLETIGWVITGFNFVEKNLSNMAVSVASMVINSLQANLTAPQLAAVQRVVDFLRELAETDPRVRLFNT